MYSLCVRLAVHFVAIIAAGIVNYFASPVNQLDLCVLLTVLTILRSSSVCDFISCCCRNNLRTCHANCRLAQEEVCEPLSCKIKQQSKVQCWQLLLFFLSFFGSKQTVAQRSFRLSLPCVECASVPHLHLHLHHCHHRRRLLFGLACAKVKTKLRKTF